MAINNQPRSFQYWNAISATPNAFNLDAGVYGLALTAGVWGSAELQKLMPDGTTYVPILGATLVGNGYAVLTLPAGQYRLVLAGITALLGEIALIARSGFR